MKFVCFYHRADLDGHCSGAIIRKYISEMNQEFVGVGFDYGDDEEKYLSFDKSDVAIIVDLCPSTDIFKKMVDFYDSVIWIDHHKTAIDEISKQDFYKNIDGLQRVGEAGCELTWKFFFSDNLPLAVKLLGRYDVFDQSNKTRWLTDILPFQYGCRLNQDNLLEDDKIDWNILLDNNTPENVISKIKQDGEICLRFQTALEKSIAQNSYECKFEGYNAIVLNNNSRGNSVFDSVVKNHQLMIIWRFEKDRWGISLYSNNVDCSIIAKKYGGGGHKGAAGFILAGDINPLNIFKLKNDK